jgi:hypothetical protein
MVIPRTVIEDLKGRTVALEEARYSCVRAEKPIPPESKDGGSEL